MIILGIWLVLGNTTALAQNGISVSEFPVGNKPLGTQGLIELLHYAQLAFEEKRKVWLQEAKNHLKLYRNGLNTTEPYDFGPDGTPLFLSSDTNLNTDFMPASFNAFAPSPLLVTGEGMTIGIWDRGLPLMTHQELENRLVPGDVADHKGLDHATLVSSVLLGKGLNPLAKGIVPSAMGVVHDWKQDRLEVAKLAAEGMLISSHAYGMESDHVPDWYFGKYLKLTRDWDQIMATMPYYLMVTSAGNSRQKGHNGAPIFGGSQEGWDVLLGAALTKNGLTVGAAKAGSYEDQMASAVVSPYSSFGPTDDGRIKPDLALDGHVGLAACGPEDNAYSSATGTSIATAKASGQLLQLQEYYHEIHGNYMRAATLKGLVLHTCTDVGAKGPDYTMGWGIMDSERAAEVIDQEEFSTLIIEGVLEEGQVFAMDIVPNGLEPLAVSLSWTDPVSEMVQVDKVPNEPTPILVHDLDVSVFSDGEAYFPWVLDPHAPHRAAGTGDNKVDPFEHIVVEQGKSGTYTIQVGHKNALVHGHQQFSLIVSGVMATDCTPLVPSDIQAQLGDSGDVEITWEDEGQADRFEIQIKSDIDAKWESHFSTEPQIIFSNLSSERSYTYRVRAFCGKRVSSDFGPGQSFSLQLNPATGRPILSDARSYNTAFPKVILKQNPVRNALYFTATVPQPARYQIFKETGQLVKEGVLSGPVLSFEGHASGPYILRLEAEQRVKGLWFYKIE